MIVMSETLVVLPIVIMIYSESILVSVLWLPDRWRAHEEDDLLPKRQVRQEDRVEPGDSHG